jgi:hypothetical protein
MALSETLDISYRYVFRCNETLTDISDRDASMTHFEPLQESVHTISGRYGLKTWKLASIPSRMSNTGMSILPAK